MGLNTLAKEFTNAARIMQSSLNELSILPTPPKSADNVSDGIIIFLVFRPLQDFP